jgi:hypothetical protein
MGEKGGGYDDLEVAARSLYFELGDEAVILRPRNRDSTSGCFASHPPSPPRSA